MRIEVSKALSIYEGPRYQRARLTMALVVLNTMFGAACVYWWAVMSLFVADPINWAAARHMTARPELFDFPFAFLWGFPIVCAAIAWVLQRVQQHRAAFIAAGFPLFYIGIIVGSYYLMPIEWR